MKYKSNIYLMSKNIKKIECYSNKQQLEWKTITC